VAAAAVAVAAARHHHPLPRHTFWFGLNLIHSTLSTAHKKNTATLNRFDSTKLY